jgi:hypothetical protein
MVDAVESHVREYAAESTINQRRIVETGSLKLAVIEIAQLEFWTAKTLARKIALPK